MKYFFLFLFLILQGCYATSSGVIPFGPDTFTITADSELGGIGMAKKKAIQEAKTLYLKGNSRVSYSSSKYTALQNADALILLTEWKEFRCPDFELIKSKLKIPIIFDGRNQYIDYNIEELGFEYHRIGLKRHDHFLVKN